MSNVTYIILALIFVLFLIKRFLKPRRDFSKLISEKRDEFRLAIQKMREEQASFGSAEALAPVLAGIKEILDLHKAREKFELKVVQNVIILENSKQSSFKNLQVAWQVRRGVLSNQARRRRLSGKGHFELYVDGKMETHLQLIPLMARISTIIRQAV